ncbi:MAG: NAD/NADP octopine/nopaline dehydrogenase family protein [Prevotella sp.]|nr:NAD/NADP octopine/nopaline dehydrogenase family protein [Prevotella sp.]
MPTTICICGGGNLGHSIAGRAAAVLEGRGEVRLLTRRPEQWSSTIRVEDDLGHVFASPLAMVTDDAGRAISDADIVLLCLPGFAITEELQRIKPFLSSHALVGSVVCSTGFFFNAFQVLGTERPLFGFQRVPFVARIAEYGHRSYIWGYRDEVFMATCHADEAQTEDLRALFATLFGTPVNLLEDYMEAALTNSNPILHTGRLYSMWRDWDGRPFDKQSFFYREWTDEASETIIAMDEEFFRLLNALHIRKGAIKTLLEHYESTDAASMTRKIRSISSLSKVMSPMKEAGSGYVPDFQSRYFIEDFPFGLAIIQRLAKERGVSTPVTDRIMAWGLTVITASRP